MGNSTTQLQRIVDSARRRAEIAPTLPVSGHADQPALDIATDVMQEMIGGMTRDLGGKKIGPFAWKWNRFPVVPAPIAANVIAAIGGFGTFLTNSWQQDYAIPGIINLGWIESCHALNINQTSQPKQVIPVEVKRELDKNYAQTSAPAKICWLPNDQLDYGIWGQSTISSATGLTNPGPLTTYTAPLGSASSPANPTVQIQDQSFGNYWVLTTYGTTGSTQPTWPSTVNYPTYASPGTAPTTQADGSCVWTAVNPKGQGFRISPVPPQSGVVWLVRVIGQMRPPTFVKLTQTLEPIPDDQVRYFRDGFYACCYRNSPDPKVRAKFDVEYRLWLQSMEDALRSGNTEQNDFGFVPDSSIMGGGYATYPGPAWPWPGQWWGG